MNVEMNDLILTKIGRDMYSLTNTSKLEAYVDKILDAMSPETNTIEFEEHINNDITDKVLSRVVASYIVDKHRNVVDEQSVYIVVDVYFKNRLVKITLGVINRNNKDVIVNGVLYR